MAVIQKSGSYIWKTAKKVDPMLLVREIQQKLWIIKVPLTLQGSELKMLKTATNNVSMTAVLTSLLSDNTVVL